MVPRISRCHLLAPIKETRRQRNSRLLSTMGKNQMEGNILVIIILFALFSWIPEACFPLKKSTTIAFQEKNIASTPKTTFIFGKLDWEALCLLFVQYCLSNIYYIYIYIYIQVLPSEWQEALAEIRYVFGRKVWAIPPINSIIAVMCFNWGNSSNVPAINNNQIYM